MSDDAELYLLSDLSSSRVPEETLFVNVGYNIISMPHPEGQKAEHSSGPAEAEE